MNIETKEQYLEIIKDNFKGMKNMLNCIEESIIKYPVYTQLEFIKPLKGMIVEAWLDATDVNNEFLNNYIKEDI